MTPDSWVNLTVVNATRQQLQVGPGTPQQSNHQYQMDSWFPMQPGKLLCPSKTSDIFMLRFLRGYGDEDDGADEFFTLGNQPTVNMFHFMARSTNESAHHFKVDVSGVSDPGGPGLPSPFVLGILMNCPDWTSITPTTRITWFANGGTNGKGPFDLGAAPSAPGCLMFVDLQAVLNRVSDVVIYYSAIKSSTLSSAQSQQLYLDVLQFMGIASAKQQ